MKRSSTLALLLCLSLSTANAADAVPVVQATPHLASQARENLKADPFLFEDVIMKAGAAAFQSSCEEIKKTKSDFDCAPGKLGAGSNRTGEDQKAQVDARVWQAQFMSLLSAERLERLLGPYQAALNDRYKFCGNTRPQIHTIGFQPELVFEARSDSRPTSAGERAVRIPIDGFALDPRCVVMGIQISGTVPVSRYGSRTERSEKEKNSDFYVTEPTPDRPDTANVILLEPYLDRLKTGDMLTISVSFSERYPPDEKKPRKVAYSKRAFTLFEIGDYRQVYQKDRIGPHSAFPLTEEEIDSLYGPLIAKNYFAVRISIRNPGATAKLVSSGGIRVTGTARVEPEPGSGEPPFAMPLTLVPHSLQEIYSILQDQEVDQVRPRTFRALELVGALATGIAAITSPGIQTTKNLGLFTGLVIPETKRAWPDRWPGYQKNLVRDAMPDLIKVGPNSRTEQPKVLFFPKKDIDGMVSDPYLFGRISGSDTPDGDIRNAKPKTYVIAVSFDNLSIRLEDLFEVENPAIRDKYLDLLGEVPALIGKLELLRPWSTQATGAKLFDLPSGTWNDAQTALTEAAKSVTAHADATTKADLDGNVIKPLKLLVDGVKPGDAKSKLKADLFGNGKAGVEALKQARETLEGVRSRLNTEGDPSAYKPRVDEAGATATAAKNALAYYQLVSKAVADSVQPLKDLDAALKVLKAKPADAAAKTALDGAATNLKGILKNVADNKPAEGISLALQ
ncbi:hypothetical protein DSM104443_00554 [Usitatibacter rugosus]|uniref:Uncharacterized protein n=1 Tax=Usitatibacter rugosus TaxID=2732067 RepID=A0A6M4GQ96_9PROT|nr:hypothetical protein [Usitatibacter rugosus]QJR09510.1 hypothetical protein DSM104443_00554 [Usitatibacter rugosus]